MKLLFGCVFLFALSGVTFGDNAVYGVRNPGDKRLIRKVILREPEYNTFHVVKEYFPNVLNNESNTQIITAVYIYDNLGVFNSSSLSAGGPGYTYATFYLSSRIGGGINTVIDIWGPAP